MKTIKFLLLAALMLTYTIMKIMHRIRLVAATDMSVMILVRTARARSILPTCCMTRANVQAGRNPHPALLRSGPAPKPGYSGEDPSPSPTTPQRTSVTKIRKASPSNSLPFPKGDGAKAVTDIVARNDKNENEPKRRRAVRRL